VIIVITCIVAVVVLAFVLGVRQKDLPAPEPVSPFLHLDERKAAIYENLRDLQFEYRLGKLSDEDYQNTKKDLQKELAVVLAEVDRIKETLAASAAVKPASGKGPAAPQKTASAATASKKDGRYACPACGAKFAQDLKFCGECGKPMRVVSNS
jgi:hypothetical protein